MLPRNGRHAPFGDRRRQRTGVEAFDDAAADDRDRDRAPSARDQLVIRAIVLVDVVRRERHTFP
jgi:hypothetical protein